MNVNKFKYGFYAVAAIVAAFFFWKSEFKDKIDLRETKEVAALEKLVKKNFDENQEVEAILFTAKEELSSNVGDIKILYTKDGVSYCNTYNVREGNNTEDKIEETKNAVTAGSSKSSSQSSASLKPIPLKNYNLSDISKNFGIAVKSIQEEWPAGGEEAYEKFELYKYMFATDEKGIVGAEITIHARRVGESTKTVGRTTTTNYYEFVFLINEKGEFELQEE